MHRRSILKGIAGLVAAASFPIGATPSLAAEIAAEAARTGVLRGQVFRLTGPVTLTGIHGLRITDCVFEYVGAERIGVFISMVDCNDVLIANCTIKGNDLVDCVFLIRRPIMFGSGKMMFSGCRRLA